MLEGCLEFMKKVVQELETGIRHADMHISEATWGLNTGSVHMI